MGTLTLPKHIHTGTEMEMVYYMYATLIKLYRYTYFLTDTHW